MWNLDRKVTSGKLVVLCGLDAHAARERGLRAFRLVETLRRDAEREAPSGTGLEASAISFSRASGTPASPIPSRQRGTATARTVTLPARSSKSSEASLDFPPKV